MNAEDLIPCRGSMEALLRAVALVPGVLRCEGEDRSERMAVALLVYGAPDPAALATAIWENLASGIGTEGTSWCEVETWRGPRIVRWTMAGTVESVEIQGIVAA
jgi:hypothetical protein